MLILLPPSEGKSGPKRGRPLDLASLSFAELNPARSQVIDALAELSSGPDALERLGVGASLADEVRANAELASVPTARADAVYTGVLFDALSPATLSATGRRRAAASIVIFSALFGALRPGDRIPPYRLNGTAHLGGLGTPTSFWRGRLDAVLPADRLVIDCRSSTYAPMWTPDAALAVRVFRQQEGRRTVVSHNAKHARGLVARALCEAPTVPRTAQDAAGAVADWFGANRMATAAGVELRVAVELTERSLDIVTA